MGGSTDASLEDGPLVEFMYLVFTLMPGVTVDDSQVSVVFLVWQTLLFPSICCVFA